MAGCLLLKTSQLPLKKLYLPSLAGDVGRLGSSPSALVSECRHCEVIRPTCWTSPNLGEFHYVAFVPSRGCLVTQHVICPSSFKITIRKPQVIENKQHPMKLPMQTYTVNLGSYLT
jgi:hypothetical protein